MKNKMIYLGISILVLIGACKKDKTDETPTPTSPTVKTVVLDVHNNLFSWRYFSFEANQEATITDYKDTLGWDLGIHYESFRTNGGKSGIGQGAVIDLGAVNFDNVTLSSIGSSLYTLDDSIVVPVSMVPPVMEKTPGCVPLEKVFASPAGPPPHTYTPNNHVYIIRTAKGKHVKFIGTSFFNDMGEEGYLNFKYSVLD